MWTFFQQGGTTAWDHLLCRPLAFAHRLPGRDLLCEAVVFPEHQVWPAWPNADLAPFLPWICPSWVRNTAQRPSPVLRPMSHLGWCGSVVSPHHPSFPQGHLPARPGFPLQLISPLIEGPRSSPSDLPLWFLIMYKTCRDNLTYWQINLHLPSLLLNVP